MASLVAKRFGVPWISTDQIRYIMRLVASRDSLPNLFYPIDLDAEKFHNKFSAKAIAKLKFAQGDTVWPAIKLLIDDYEGIWHDGCVIEGVNILPHLVARDLHGVDAVKTIYLFDESSERVGHLIKKRGIWDKPSKYSDKIKIKELKWVMQFSRLLKTDVVKYGYPLINTKKEPQDLERVLEILAEKHR